MPPRANAVPSEAAETAPTQRDRHLRTIQERSRMAWQSASGYNWCALVEAEASRFKPVIGVGRSRPRFPVHSTWNAGGGCARVQTCVARSRWRLSSVRLTAFLTLDARGIFGPRETGLGKGIVRPAH